MKHSILILLFLLCGSGLLRAQKAVSAVTDGLDKGNAAEISKYFDKIVDITLNNEQSTYSKSQATIILENFFSKHPTKTFQVKHKGNPADNSSVYIIGSLSTKNESQYRIYLYFKEKSGDLFLQEIRFEQ